MMKEKFGIKIAPRGLIYVPPKMSLEVPWEDQERVVLPSSVPDERDGQAEEDSDFATRLLNSKRRRSPAHSEEQPKRKVRIFLYFSRRLNLIILNSRNLCVLHPFRANLKRPV